MTFEALFTLAVILVTVGLVAREFLSPDYLLLGGLLVLAASGVVEPDEALQGFANPALATIGGLFLVAGGVRATGIIDRVTAVMFGSTESLRPVLARLTSLTAVASGFMSNTAIVALGIPTLDRWARRHGISPSRLLMPLSFASIMGGLLTLIGTSTNVVVDGLMRQNGIEGLGFFELAIVGVPIIVVGVAYLTLVAPVLLPARESPEPPSEEMREYVTEVTLQAPSDLIGRTVEEAGLGDVEDLYLVRIDREARVISPVEPGEELVAGDRLTFAGRLERIVQLVELEGIELVAPAPAPEKVPTWEFYQAVVTPGSPLVGSRIEEAEFRARYNAAVLAIQRRGEELPQSIAEVSLRPGDTLILEAGPEFGRAHRESSAFFVVSPLEGTVPRQTGKQWVAGGLLVAMIAAAATGLLALPIAAPIAGLLMIVTGCVSPEEARRSVDWSVLVAIGSAIGIAHALEASGGADLLGQGISALAAATGEWGLLLGVFFGTLVLTELIINQAAAALMFPIVLALATSQGLDPRPLVLTATVAASLSFSTPLNYQTNLMVYGPGKYRFSDFTRVGVPLQLVLSVVAVAVIRWAWPLAAA
ncbi:MAG: SLC13 family permease [Gemmatimonadota bacterium]